MAKYVSPKVVNSPKSDNSAWNWDWARDGNTLLNKGGWKLLGKACAIYVQGSERKSDYHLPHHKWIKGALTVVWGGCRAAMQRLRATRVPLDAKRKAYNHLASHYRGAFGKEPPPFKEVLSPDEQKLYESLFDLYRIVVRTIAQEVAKELNVDAELVEQYIDLVGSVDLSEAENLQELISKNAKHVAEDIRSFIK
ncbi:MAG: hypothetical protein J7L51_02340 [Desulfurococcales archaeon]|nr:hypothetical protein [Desulfurococcales archaeon]